MKNTFFSNFVILIKGMCMGIADIVPGVSGGTIAIITGVYEELLKTINKFDFKILKEFRNGKAKTIWETYNLNFLSFLGFGILLSIVILSHFILILLNEYPIALWSLFLGLISSSIIFLFKTTSKLNFKNSKYLIPSQLYFLIIGGFIALYIQTLSSSSSIEVNSLYLFFCGMISITAMLLPGISGAYILVLLGAYETMLITLKEVSKLNSEYFMNFISFALGALLSIKLFSKLLTWSYNNYKNNTLFCLIGFMIGSLPTLWPWKKNSDSSFFLDRLYIPENYFNNSEFNEGILFFIIGIILVLLLEFISNKNEKKK
jgi:putative membrane protein